MYTVYTALAVCFFIIFVPYAIGASLAWTILPGILLGVFTFIWINRRVAKRVEAVTQAADAELAGLQQVAQRPGAQAAIASKFDRAITILKTGFMFQKWQVGVGVMLNARIGMLLYTRWMLNNQMGGKKDNSPLTEAIPYLQRSQIKGKKAQLLKALWPAWAMLAVAHYQGKGDVAAALRVLEDTVGISKKEGLLWNLYAWILWKEGRLDEAINVLARAAVIVPDDKRVTENLSALQNKKGMKMRDYGEQWYQFGLEQPKMAGMKQRMGHPRMRPSRKR